MKEILSKFTSVCENPYKELLQRKQQGGRRIIGCVPMHVPEEMIHAAGMLPVTLWESDEPIIKGNMHVQTYFCGLVRSIVDIALKGKLDFLDGVVFPDTCMPIRGLPYMMQKNVPMAYYETICLPPILSSPVTLPRTLDELHRFQASLEQFTGQKISPEALKASIRVYNENRALLRRLYDWRRQNPGVLSAKEILSVVMASTLMPKEEHTALLQRLLPELEALGPAKQDDRVRLVLSGCFCEAAKADILDLIEEVGGVVVDDDLYMGYRYFAIDAKVDGDPVESLARRYLEMTPCPTKIDFQKSWGDYLGEKCQASRCQGVITWMVKFCEPHEMYYPATKERLAELGIPHLFLETEHEVFSLARIKTELQAFVEMVGRKK